MIKKAFRILESMANRDSNTINSLSQQTGIPKSTVHRILTILAEEQMVVFWPGRGYVLTPKLLSLGIKGLGQKELLDVAIPVMRAVSEKTKETVSLTVICGIERVCVYRVEGEYPIQRKINIGDRGPLFRGSAGKVIAAGLSKAELNSMIEKYVVMGVLTNEQVPNVLTETELVKKRGYAVSIEERMPGCASVAVPILDILDQTLASLSISGITERMGSAEIDSYVTILRNAAAEISFQVR